MIRRLLNLLKPLKLKRDFNRTLRRGPKAKILVVDDEAGIREFCTRILRENYEVSTAPDGPTAVAMAKTAPPDLLLTDIRMPGMSGLEAAKQIVAGNPEMSVVVITGFVEFDTLLDAVRLGVSGFLMKPFTPEDLRKTVEEGLRKSAIAIANARPLFERHEQSYWNTVYALAATVNLRDHPTREHSDRLAKYAVAIGARLELSPERLEDLKIAALLHDIGKIGIADGVLRKPGDLTAEEYDWMKTHTLMGAKILAMMEFSSRVVEAVLFHHEHYNGSGYPEGRRGEDIPLGSRIIMVANAFDVITSNTPYRQASSKSEALRELKEHAGSQFDPEVVRVFESVIDRV